MIGKASDSLRVLPHRCPRRTDVPDQPVKLRVAGAELVTHRPGTRVTPSRSTGRDTALVVGPDGERYCLSADISADSNLQTPSLRVSPSTSVRNRAAPVAAST